MSLIQLGYTMKHHIETYKLIRSPSRLDASQKKTDHKGRRRRKDSCVDISTDFVSCLKYFLSSFVAKVKNITPEIKDV